MILNIHLILTTSMKHNTFTSMNSNNEQILLNKIEAQKMATIDLIRDDTEPKRESLDSVSTRIFFRFQPKAFIQSFLSFIPKIMKFISILFFPRKYLVLFFKLFFVLI